VKVEDTDGGLDTVTVNVATPVGTSVRSAGGDVTAGARVMEAGTRLGPPELGMLASVGMTRPRVRRRPVAAIMATGDELRPPDTPTLEPGQIRDSNSTVMATLLTDLGAEVRNYGIVGDDPGRFNQLLEAAAGVADIIVTSGGVSMGDYDVVKQAGRADVGFYQVAMQPGKPFAFGQIDGVPFFGLPGNPVSVLVSFEQFMRPALLQMMGSSNRFRPQIPGVAAEPMATNPEKLVFVRVAVTWERGRATAVSSGGQSSHQLSGLVAADAFALVPVGTGTIDTGDAVTLEMFRWPEDH
jgi:molybdopterin molybdotransferase